MRLLSFLLNLNFIVGYFLNIPFGPKFKISKQEINKQIKYDLPIREKEIVNKINGFYGLIGPDVNMTTVKTLYELFTGDGNIQGVFFNNGNLTFVKNYVRTDKLVYEEQNGRIPNNSLITAIFMLLHKMKTLPNILGLANTAFLNIKGNIYALFERDLPYLLDINFENSTINTIKKNHIENLEHFSGHSKYNKETETIDTIDYNVLTNIVTYYKLNMSFGIIQKKEIYTKYIPIIHDFLVLENGILITDSPMVYDLNNEIYNNNMKIPVVFNKTANTKIHVFDQENNKVDSYESKEGFFIFHYADHKETKNIIEIFACLYTELDFNKLNIEGKYRKIIIDKRTQSVTIETNKNMEKYNLDFPLKYKKQIIFRNIHNNAINELVVTENLKIQKIISTKDKNLCGEPTIIEIDKNPYILSFAYDKCMKGYMLVINIQNSRIIEIPLEEQINVGFHSIFIPR